MECSKNSNSPEEFMVSLVKNVDKNDKGYVSYEEAVQGFKEYFY